MSGVAVATGRDLGGVKRINRTHWNDDDSQRSSWLAALRQHLHLKPAELEPLLAIAEATKARRVREQVISRRSSRALRFEPEAHSGIAAQ